MTTFLPHSPEPTATKEAMNAASADVREAALRQASDFAAPVYQQWKDQLGDAGIDWQTFEAAASHNRNAWRGWLDGDLTWRQALVGLIEQLDQESGASLVLER
jgi:hypothetical protein